MRFTHGKSTLRTILALGAAAVALGGCNLSFGSFPGATTQGHNIFRLWQGSVIAALAVGVIVWGLIFWAVVRYRKKGDSIPVQTENNFLIEIIYTTVPVILVAVLFFFTVITENSVDNVSAHPAVAVHVTGFQWGWRFDYTGQHVSEVSGVTTYPTMVLPLGQETTITLTTTDVIHGFYVAKFDFSRFAQSGVVNKFDFTPNQTGTFLGRCTQFCGLRHDQMLFYVKVVTPNQYHQWLAGQQAQQAQTQPKVGA
ncbi:MAG: cytochrome c oxidase subunit II [Acidimicrobiales bacterium]